MTTQNIIGDKIDKLLRDWTMPGGSRYQIYKRSRKDDKVSSIAQAVWSLLEEENIYASPRVIAYDEVRSAVVAYQRQLSEQDYNTAMAEFVRKVIRRPTVDSQGLSSLRKGIDATPLKKPSRKASKETEGDLGKKRSLAQDREIYELWYEYLKRSEDYKEFCEWVKEKRKNQTTPVPDKFKKDDQGGAPIILFIFMKWHDVHMWPFETIWDHFLKIRKWNDDYWNNRPEISMKYYPYFVEAELNGCIEDFRRYENREPTAEELRDYFLQMLGSDEDRGVIILRVSTTLSMESLKKRFIDIIRSEKEKRKNPWKGCTWLGKPAQHPLCLTKNNYKKDLPVLKRRLRAFDLNKEGKKVKEIVEILLREGFFNEADKQIEDMCRDDFKEARQTIKNVEKGIFPGEGLRPKKLQTK